VDSTGLKVLGEGEWKVRRHGADRRWVWRKAYRAIDAKSHEIRAVEMTDHRHGDAKILPDLLAQVLEEGIASVIVDGVYDIRMAYEAAVARNAALLVRLAETAISRLKRLGERLAAHDAARQIAEVQIRCAILNTYNRLGTPGTVAVA
jgi:hypothetical protein